ncbi:MAG: tetratricopeptide repeat protein [Kiritimatiellia bacterium]
MKMRIQTGLAALAATFIAAEAAAVQGVITMPNGSKREGEIKWIARDKAYGIVEKGRSIEMQLKPEEIAGLQIPRPRELDAAIEAIRQGNANAAIPMLEKIASDYMMLQWDKPATRYLAEAHVQAGNADKAIAVCEKVIAADPEAAYLGEMAPVYWQALIKRERLSKVEELLGKAIKTGDRLASANALIARGDLIQQAGGDTPRDHCQEGAARRLPARESRSTGASAPRSRKRCIRRPSVLKTWGRPSARINCGPPSRVSSARRSGPRSKAQGTTCQTGFC